ncbi:MAG: 50S ribosomal protein L25 [Dehalococcoidia bacterium]|jgi:large subunit ribosomal protein L25|nr:50S ribosomal protein L25 [Dehalococcoidia bacterium]
MSNVEINADVRTSRGKGDARKLRATDRIPAVLYGPGQEATSLSLNPADVERLRRSPLGWNTPIEMVVDGLAGSQLAMIQEMQRHPISRQLLHVDFLVIDRDRRLEVSVAIHAVGKAAGLEEGGRLNIMRRSIQVQCLAKDIPEAIEVDVTEMEVGDAVFVDEIELPAGVVVLYDERFPILAVTTKGGVEEEEEEEVEDEEGEGEGEGADEDGTEESE